MIFDLFHSISDPMVGGKTLGSRTIYKNFLDQVKLAENLGMDTVWIAESHFSSETQKKTSDATIPNFRGEVGLNADSFQTLPWIANATQKINLGTAIHNIVGGSGGPIASADRVNFLNFLNRQLWNRTLRMGIASGRFSYQNTPFGIAPRTETEAILWPILKRAILVEAIEIFLRLLRGEELSSKETTDLSITEKDLGILSEKEKALAKQFRFPLTIKKRWNFESLKLVPEGQKLENLRIVLGSSDPWALGTAQKYWDVDLFNLSFTPPEQIEALHEKMHQRCLENKSQWSRARLPRTVLIFIDKDQRKARRLADEVLEAYIEAMKGTAHVPQKTVLLERALVGDPSAIRDQLSPENPRQFHSQDRLMLWFEFNQLESQDIMDRMKLFFEEVVGRV